MTAPPTRILNEEFCATIRNLRDTAIRLVSILFEDLLSKEGEDLKMGRMKIDLFNGCLLMHYQIELDDHPHEFSWKMHEHDLLWDERPITEILREEVRRAVGELEVLRPYRSNFQASFF